MPPDKSQKTEAPTQRRLKDARDKGQVAKSADLSAWVGVLAAIFLLQVTISRGGSAMRSVLHEMGMVIAHPSQPAAIKFTTDAALTAVGILAPMLCGMLVITIAVAVAQVGFHPTGKKMKPDFGRLNPLKGLKRMFGMQVWWEVAKSIAKLILLIAIVWPAASHAIHAFAHNQSGSLTSIAAITAKTAMTLIRNVALGGLAIGGVDYIVQRRRLMKDLKMSRHEVREEMKQHEGNPEVKRAIRGRQRAISRNRMIGLVSTADVVIVNPTHYAVALKYEATRGAPEVVAKGAGDVAKRIRQEAEANGVPVVHEAALCRTIYWACELGQLIPADLYEAVAQLLAFVFGLRAKGKAAGYHELPKPALL